MGLANRQSLKAIGLQQAWQITDGARQFGPLAAMVLEAELPDAGGTDPDFTGGIDQQAMDGGGETGRIRRGQGCSKLGPLREQRVVVPGGEFDWIQGLQQGIQIG